eukprot:TRINITY_DN75786_c0_g1_i1.p1 TRINITY_DN75786_c0_g1~~TRINITY_DN75786_c0_g1_i1.p1  ORF type:complete len:355 (-),score=150.84 TRINITY_DN75786_c0_g1_i1:80-1042(-)
MDECRREAMLRRKHGTCDRLEEWDGDTVRRRTGLTGFVGAIHDNTARQMHPAKFVVGVAREAVKRGGRIFVNCGATRVERLRGSLSTWLVHTSSGRTIQTEHVVLALNGYLSSLLPHVFTDIVVPVRAQMTCVRGGAVQAKIPFNMLFNLGYDYCIQRDDNTLLLGGKRWVSPTNELNITNDAVVNPAVGAALQEELNRMLLAKNDGEEEDDEEEENKQDSVPIDAQWTGIMGFSRDGLPFVGGLDGHHGLFVAGGYTGCGMPVAYGAGKVIAQMIAGRKLSDEFPRRLIPSAKRLSDALSNKTLFPPPSIQPTPITSKL